MFSWREYFTGGKRAFRLQCLLYNITWKRPIIAVNVEGRNSHVMQLVRRCRLSSSQERNVCQHVTGLSFSEMCHTHSLPHESELNEFGIVDTSYVILPNEIYSLWTRVSAVIITATLLLLYAVRQSGYLKLSLWVGEWRVYCTGELMNSRCHEQVRWDELIAVCEWWWFSQKHRTLLLLLMMMVTRAASDM